ncbi:MULTISPECIES: methylated-DNA--[protein]-cysteine S-methyltransferase [unclassified Streptomyces]|uniref:methylated-DNA--[protein]-cysteine S-methyltransferase n=1 Tax=unclassified Streptomyces TaxID=2593676 RepID=UPI00048D7565|nr:MULTISPECIES: methylated-DNA--[protein]-cysteine S-methyltransferase [unclassified Streptomyces]MYY17016.1 methylated-DNA--[protein]-cysteine S-methyltransferase [Streptomyces sp. SID4912]SCD50098.1 methylated-DNA-[protein]-cysteine S-methyltransferase [Streptomyces sp. DpondAA-D4]
MTATPTAIRKPPATRQHTVLDSPYGPLTLVAPDGVLAGLYMTEQRHRPPEESFGVPDPEPFAETVRQLDAYFAGDLTTFDLPLRLDGTPFQRAVWAELRQIPYGETRSYGELAERLGKPGASRAVGLANGRNPVGIIVPCHRVVGATGGLTGYGGGLDRKRRLLDFERGEPSEAPALF